jgi:hypothetical protein
MAVPRQEPVAPRSNESMRVERGSAPAVAPAPPQRSAAPAQQAVPRHETAAPRGSGGGRSAPPPQRGGRPQ